MCGRTACSLSKQSISNACAYRDNRTGEYMRCEWFEGKDRNDKPMDSYEPDFNQTSGHYLPVLVQNKVIDTSCESSHRRVLAAMRWGLRPHWLKSSDNSFNLNPINCRFETMTQKKTFSNALKSGRRCVVLVEGFFEWKTNKDNTKDPYFLYFPQNYVDFKNRNKDWIKNESQLNADNEWKGPRLLTIAGIFNKSTDNLLSFTIITVPIHPSLEWLHNRMPAILDSDHKINDWLDFENVSIGKAMELLVPFDGLQYHSVSNSVSNVRNNTIENILPLKSNHKQKTIEHWFKPKNTNKCLKSNEDIIEENGGIKAKKLKEEMESKD